MASNSASLAPVKKKLTVAELIALKGQRKIVLSTAFDEWTARAAEAAGVDMLVAWGPDFEATKYIVAQVRKGAPNTLIGTGINPGAYESREKAIQLAEEIRAIGADIMYASGIMPRKFKPLSQQNYPCCGHVGYLPVNNTWFGGPRAVGKTAVEAQKVFKDVMDFEKAGCIAIELECVPARVAAEITQRTKMLVFSMGSGPDCDGQYIFAEDLLGTNGGHYPRHSITYTNLYDRAVEGLAKYRSEVLSGAYPTPNHTIKMKTTELAAFREFANKQQPKNKPSVPPSMQIANSAGPRKKKLTVAELQALKGQRKLVLCTAFDEWTARAAEAAGVDMLVSWGDSMESTKYIVKQVRKGAPNTLIGSGINPGAYESAEKALRLAEELRAVGTDIIYCSGLVPEKFGALSHQHYPCCGHVGYLPVNDTWFGGPRAVGKTAVEAEKLFNDVMELEAAGCIAIELECVPAKVAAELTRSTKMLVFSMGSGPDCDGQFIFAEDLLGTNGGHYPRHSITYTNLFDQAVEALKKYRSEVLSLAYPKPNHTIKMKREELAVFRNKVSKPLPSRREKYKKGSGFNLTSFVAFAIGAVAAGIFISRRQL